MYKSAVKYALRRRDLALWVFPSQWSSCVAIDLKSGRTWPFPLQLLPKEGAMEYRLCFTDLMDLAERAGAPQGCIWRAKWGDLPCIALVSRDLVQSICQITLSCTAVQRRLKQIKEYE